MWWVVCRESGVLCLLLVWQKMKSEYFCVKLQRGWIRLFVGVVVGVGMMMTPMTPTTGRRSAVVMLVVGLALTVYLFRTYGWISLTGIGIVALLGVTIEYIWLKTCLPYGCFSYTELIGPRVWGTFPVSLVIIRPVIVVSMNQFVPPTYSLLKKSLLGWLILVLFDLLLDPVAVYLGLRTYAAWGVRFGVPRTNYLWRLLTGTVSSRIMHRRSSALIHDCLLHCVAWMLRGMYGAGFITQMLQL